MVRNAANPSSRPAPKAKKPVVRKNPAVQRIMDEAYRLMKAGSNDQAELLFRKILAAEPGNPFAIYALGILALRGRNTREGVRLLELALQSGYVDPTVYTHLGLAYFAEGDLEKAEATYRTGLQKDPKNPHYPTNLAVIHARRGEHEQAQAMIQAALKLNPDFVPALTNAANIYMATNQLQRSAEMFEKVLELAPGNEYADQTLKLLRTESAKA